MSNDVTEFRVGRSHGDIIYHHVEGRPQNLDPRWAVCQSREEASFTVSALNNYFEGYSEAYFNTMGLRW